MIAAVAAIGALLLSVAIMVTGNGLQGTLITIRANLEAFNAAEIGLLVSGYYAGFIAGCIACPYMVARVGHIRSFAALAVIAAGTALIYPMVVVPWVWWLLRGIAGFALAGLYTVIESWLNDRATNQNRGALFSIYRAVDLSANTAGLLLLNAADPAGFQLFSLSALLMSIALVPVALTRGVAPAPIAAAKLQLGRLFSASPLGVVGIFLVAAANASTLGLVPIFVQRIGYDVAAVSYVMAALVVGGAVAQYPVGWLSDRFDRRSVVIVFAILAVVGSAGMAVAAQETMLVLVTATAIFGAITMPLYSLLIAHTNDFLEPHEFVSASGGLLLIYGVGAVIGPMAAASIMLERPPWLLFAFTATTFGLLVAYALYRVTRRAPLPMEEQGHFVMPSLTTPQAFELDPRAETTEESPETILSPAEELPPVEEVVTPPPVGSEAPETETRPPGTGTAGSDTPGPAPAGTERDDTPPGDDTPPAQGPRPG